MTVSHLLSALASAPDPADAVAPASRTPVIGLALSDSALLALVTEAPPAAYAALRDVVDLTAGVLYLGGDRFRPRPADHRYIDPLFAAQTVLTRLPQAAALVSTSPDVEHPYNFARRIATLDHFTEGRIGAVVGTRDRRADRIGTGATPWTEAPTGPALTADFHRVLRLLWNSWPRESIVVDKDCGVFADGSQIVRIDHDGLYSVAGALNSSSSIQGEPPLGLHTTLGSAEVEAVSDAELVIADGTAPEAPGRLRIAVAAADAVLGTGPGAVGADLVLVAVDDVADLPGLAGRLSQEGTAASGAGIVSGTADAGAGSRILRERLGLPARRLDTSGLAPAFPA